MASLMLHFASSKMCLRWYEVKRVQPSSLLQGKLGFRLLEDQHHVRQPRGQRAVQEARPLHPSQRDPWGRGTLEHFSRLDDTAALVPFCRRFRGICSCPTRGRQTGLVLVDGSRFPERNSAVDVEEPLEMPPVPETTCPLASNGPLSISVEIAGDMYLFHALLLALPMNNANNNE